jgi:hypothetical protein
MSIRTYITDDEFRFLARDIPWPAALEWARTANPEDFAALPVMDRDGRWTNKYGIRVGENHTGELWLYNHDGSVWLLELPWK